MQQQQHLPSGVVVVKLVGLQSVPGIGPPWDRAAGASKSATLSGGSLLSDAPFGLATAVKIRARYNVTTKGNSGSPTAGTEKLTSSKKIKKLFTLPFQFRLVVRPRVRLRRPGRSCGVVILKSQDLNIHHKSHLKTKCVFTHAGVRFSCVAAELVGNQRYYPWNY